MRFERALSAGLIAAWMAWTTGCQGAPVDTTAAPPPSTAAQQPAVAPPAGPPDPARTGTQGWTAEKVQRDLQGHYDFMRSGVMNRDVATFMHEFDETYRRRTLAGAVVDRKETERMATDMLTAYQNPTWTVQVKACAFKDDVAHLIVERSFSGTRVAAGAPVAFSLTCKDTWNHATGSWRLMESVVTQATGPGDPGKLVP